MRHTKILLKIVRDNLERIFEETPYLLPGKGICSVVSNCFMRGLITPEENNKIIKYLDNNKPDFAKQREHDLADETDENGYYLGRHWWTPGEVEPRINWLNEQINKL